MPGVWNVQGVCVCVCVCVLYKCLECIARVAVCGVFSLNVLGVCVVCLGTVVCVIYVWVSV